MTAKQELVQLADSLPEQQLRQAIDFLRFLAFQEERHAWREWSRAGLSKAYGDDEPEYTHADIKPRPKLKASVEP